MHRSHTLTSEPPLMQTIQKAEPTTSSDYEPLAISTVEEPLNPVQPKRPVFEHKFEGQAVSIEDFVFLHDNVHIVTGSRDGTMRKWNCNRGLLVGDPWDDARGRIYALALSPNKRVIACGRVDGSVLQWNIDGEMIGTVWTGHHRGVRSLSWSPNGDYLASGSSDGTILIRDAKNGASQVAPIKSEQGGVFAVAYSPAGDRIASGGSNYTICIWSSKTSKLLVSPIEALGACVTSVVWSSDSTKLYSASDKFARVFDSNTGAELHHFQHTQLLTSIALSPKYNLLACVGYGGVLQLWDTDSRQPLNHPLLKESQDLFRVSFSGDGKSLAYSRNDKITQWMIKDIAPELPETRAPSPSPDIDATLGQGQDNPYSNFFQSYPSAPSHHFRHSHPSPGRRLWNMLSFSRHRPTANESTPLQQRSRGGYFARHTGPQPVTVFAGRRKQRRWIARPPTSTSNAHSNQSSSTTQPASAAQPQLQPQHPQTPQQPAEEYDYGCWGNFCLALCCIPRRPRRIVSIAQPAAS